MTEKIIKMKYPVTLIHQGRRFYRTGKEGLCMKTGQEGREYSYTGPNDRGIQVEIRVWKLADGTIHED